MLKHFADVLKKNPIILTALFLLVSFIPAFTFRLFEDYYVSIIVSLVAWIAFAVFSVITKFPAKILEPLNKIKLIMAIVFAMCSSFVYSSLNRNFFGDFDITSFALFAVSAYWFYYSVLPELTENFKKRLYFSAFTVCAFVLITVIYLPFESYISNIDSFEFDISNFAGYYLMIALFSIITFTLLLNTFKAKYYWVVYKITVAVNIAIFVQYMFLNNHMSLLGVANDYTVRVGITVVNLLIWIAIFVAVFLIPKFLKDKWPKIYKVVTVAILCYHIVALIILAVLAPSNAYSTTVEFYTDSSEQFTLSSNKNVVIIIFDAFDNSVLKQIAENNPSRFDTLNDFTVYTNTASVFDSTITSMNQMFGGCHFDNTLQLDSWLSEGWDSDSTIKFYDELHKQNFKFNGYNFEMPRKNFAIGKIDSFKAYDNPENIVPTYFGLDKFFWDFTQLTTYRIVPYAVKNFISFDSDTFKYYCTYPLSDVSSFSNESYLKNMDYKFTDSNIINVNHLRGLHSPCVIQDEVNNCFSIMNKLIDQMKEKGIYDSSTIIFMADHGYHNEDIPSGWGATPLFMIKEPNVSKDIVSFNSTPISTEDIMGTIAVNVGLDNPSAYGTSIYDFDEDSVRTRCFYDRVRSDDLPDVYSSGKLSYIIWYNAFAKYEFTGNSDILYGNDPFVNGNEILPMKEYIG